jgi:hypothetical protein
MLYQLSYASQNHRKTGRLNPKTRGHTGSRRVRGTEIKISTAPLTGQTRIAPTDALHGRGPKLLQSEPKPGPNPGPNSDPETKFPAL